jgi:hypothetical protein
MVRKSSSNKEGNEKEISEAHDALRRPSTSEPFIRR